MKILLDECVDRRLAKEIKGHSVKTVPQAGWAGIKNGRLLALAEKEFDLFVTIDGNMSAQQKLSKFKIAIIVLQAATNRLADITPLVPAILQALPKLKERQTITIGRKEEK